MLLNITYFHKRDGCVRGFFLLPKGRWGGRRALPTAERCCQGDFDRIRHKCTRPDCISIAETREKMKQLNYLKRV